MTMLYGATLLQVGVPLAVMAWVAFRQPRSQVAWGLASAAAGAWLIAGRMAGIWLVAPAWLPLASFVLLAGAITWGRVTAQRTPTWPRGPRPWLECAAVVLLLVSGVALAGVAMIGRTPPAAPLARLTFPLHDGTYYVAAGGSVELINPHIKTLSDPRFAGYRAQSYGTDLTAADHQIFNDPLYAPCDGVVLQAEDGHPDMPVGTPDRSHMTGNYVLVDCDPALVFLGHLRRGSVAVGPGAHVTPATQLGRVGNSGNSDTPHLHIHAQRRTADVTAFLGGEPLPATFDGRYLVRNDTVDPHPVPERMWTASRMVYAQIGSSIVALLMLAASLWQPAVGRMLFLLLFGCAALVNLRMALTAPDAYLDYATLTVSDTYRQFILGPFARHVTGIVTSIAAGQALIALFVRRRGWTGQLALIAAIVFLLAIVPLGVGSGFPATIVMAMAAGTMLHRPRESASPALTQYSTAHA